jgi:hypothetical protein
VRQQPGISIRLPSAPSFLQSSRIRRSSAVRGKSSGGTVSRAILSIIQACTVCEIADLLCDKGNFGRSCAWEGKMAGEFWRFGTCHAEPNLPRKRPAARPY